MQASAGTSLGRELLMSQRRSIGWISRVGAAGLTPLILGAVLPRGAHADPVTMTIGDMDGFSLGTQVNEPFDPEPIANYWMGMATGWNGDGDGTDVWKHTPGGLDTYIFDFIYADVPKFNAFVDLFHGGTAIDARLHLDGVDVAGLTAGELPGRFGNFARFDRLDLTPFLGLVDGNDTFEIKTIQGDDLAVDYISLHLNIPEPASGAMSLAAAGAITRRRKRQRILAVFPLQ
jgi:hypothetical protein